MDGAAGLRDADFSDWQRHRVLKNGWSSAKERRTPTVSRGRPSTTRRMGVSCCSCEAQVAY